MDRLSTRTNHEAQAARPRVRTIAELAAQLDRIEVLLADRVMDKPLPFKEAAEYLNLAPSTLYKMTAANKIKFSKPNGKKIFFKRPDLDKYLAQNPTTPTDEIESLAIAHTTGGRRAG